MCQSNAICRHIGRKHAMYGSSHAEAAMIDQIMDGVEDVRVKYLKLIYQDQLVSGQPSTLEKQRLARGNVLH
jgi:hypothetical protein